MKNAEYSELKYVECTQSVLKSYEIVQCGGTKEEEKRKNKTQE